MSNQPVLAIEGGPKAVTVPVDDSWSKISSLEKDHVNAALDNFDSAYGELDKFEEEFRQMVGTRYALAMCNGTATIHSAVFASGAREGKEVIVPSVTWHASISPILHCGATPVFCDVDPRTYCADPEDVKSRITSKTCAIVVTHTYGNPADMDAFLEIVDGTDIVLIEDASHAHGAMWDGRQVGSVGHIGCFSLQGSKAVTGFEAGVATTDDPALYDRMLVLGQYGRIEKLAKTDEFTNLHNMGLGVKYRANPLGMAMARGQLQRLPELNDERSRWFQQLDDALYEIPGVHSQQTYPKATRGGMLLYAGTLDADVIGAPVSMILKALVAEGVPTTPEITPYGYGAMHLEPLFNDFSFDGVGGPWADFQPNTRRLMSDGDLPVSEMIHQTRFWLSTPVSPSPEWVRQVAEAFSKVASQGNRLSELAGE